MTALPVLFGASATANDAGGPSDEAADPSRDADWATAGGVPTLATLEDASVRAHHYAGRSKAASTIAAYATDWHDFLGFCQLHGAQPLPASDQTVAAYLAALADARLKAATIARRLVTISQAHKAADLPSPTASSLVRRTHAGIRRSIGTAQAAKAPAVVSDLRRMLDALPATRVGLRDRALLLLGFGGAFRRSELVGLNMADLEFSSAGVVVTLRKSKTDQEQSGRRVAVPYGSSETTCPVRSLQAWLAAAHITEGALFRSLDRFQRVQP